MTPNQGLRAAAIAVVMSCSGAAQADTLKVLTAGAFKQVLTAALSPFEAVGHQVEVQADTVGGLVKRITAGETFDMVIASPAGLATLRKAGKVGDADSDLARVGVGIAVKEGAVRPDISTVDSFKKALLAAKHVTYINPAAGGSSGIYLDGLINKLGIGDEIRAKAVLVNGGFSADRVVSGEADIAVQQISELLPVKGVVLVGPLPSEIQNYTVYSAAIAAGTARKPAVQALIDLLQSKQGRDIITAKGMEPVGSTPNK
ncbi:substrate-binding domain-containing protein [Tardiphaga sp.]|uniref:molybdate ABC transporter substrate-binding protein n=1 Tax=Tardiphaga sp. TaxID=1926292 RepID=UPI00261E93BF|nr:substrate-binding domain-containing protein [Tardiphaga sp.]MDB5616440.1 bacterial extracellular solute-binding family protein [Tardiphaga sp.]